MAKYSTKENLVLNDKVKFDNKGGAILGVLEGPVADFINPTRNGRHYGEQLWEKVLSNDIVKEQFANGGILGELDHPKDRDDICTEKVAVIMPEPPVKNSDGEYIGKFNILDTPCGRIVYTLAKAGFRLGVSSRGNGDYDEYTGEVDPDSYDFTCFDVVVLPAVKDARMNLITEAFDKNTSLSKLLKEQYDRSSKEDKAIMDETIKHLKENFDQKHKCVCVICGHDFEGYGNNAEPVKPGICCDECNETKVLPARLKQSGLKEDKDKDIPDITVKDAVLSVDIDDAPKVEKTEGETEPCEECEEFDTKLKDFLDAFLKTQDLETEGEEEKDLFVKLFHETFPELDCCAEKHNDIDDEVEDKDTKDLAAEDTGADTDVELLEQLQKALKDNKSLKEELRKLQADKAVGNSKVTRLNEELEQFKNIAALAGKKALSLKDYSSENAELREKLSTLNENLSKAIKESSENKSLKDKVQESLDIKTKENDELKEKLQQTTKSSKLVEDKYQKAVRLVEKYKKLAHEIANRYIDNKALELGVTSNEIKNRLNESYTLDDVDKVCEDLEEYSINISKLPFQIDKPTSARARLREDRSSDPLKSMDSEYDDTVDDYLLDLAGLKN